MAAVLQTNFIASCEKTIAFGSCREWYKRLVEAAELATQSELTQSGVVTKH